MRLDAKGISRMTTAHRSNANLERRYIYRVQHYNASLQIGTYILPSFSAMQPFLLASCKPAAPEHCALLN
jgi:hypothetical protein